MAEQRGMEARHDTQQAGQGRAGRQEWAKQAGRVVKSRQAGTHGRGELAG
jgi:hypothetical protein